MKTFTFLKSLNKGYTKYSFFTTLLLLCTSSFAQIIMNAPTLTPARWEAKLELFPVDNVTGLPKFIRIPVLFTNPDTTRVGIGTNTPLAKLDLRGALRLGTLTNNIAWQFREENITGVGPCMIFENINPNTSLSKNFVFRTTGNIGIGTDIPEAKLDVNGNLIIRGNINAKSISLSGNINANSLSLTDGITATNLSLSNNLTTNNLTVTGSLTAINLSLTGNINANSLSLTDGITATNLSLSNNLTTNNLTVTGNFNAANLNLSGSISVADLSITNSLNTTGNIISTNGIIKSGNSVWLDGSQNAVYSSGTLALLRGYGLDGNTKVGIGTKTPQKALHVYSEHQGTGGSPDSHYGIRLDYHESAPNKTSSWDIEPKFSDKGANSILSFKDVISNKYLLTLADNDSISINGKTNIVGNLSILGNVGIGTATPEAPLHITGSGNKFISISSSTTTSNSGTEGLPHLRLLAVASNNITEAQIQFRGRLRFVKPLGTEGGTDRMVIDEEGKVGIGTSLPDAKLHLMITGQSITNFPGTANALFKISHSSNTEWAAEIYNNGGDGKGLRILGASGDGTPVLQVENGGGNTLLKVEAGGEVGIGTASPGYKLDVCGTIRAKKVLVESGWCDYVFDENYKRLSILNKEKFYKQNNHLPNIPPAKEIETYGLDISDVMKGMVQNIEEDRLDITELYKIIMQQQMEIEGLKNELQVLKK